MSEIKQIIEMRDITKNILVELIDYEGVYQFRIIPKSRYKPLWVSEVYTDLDEAIEDFEFKCNLLLKEEILENLGVEDE